MSTTSVTKIAAKSVSPNRRRGGDVRVLLSPVTVGATAGLMGVVVLQPGEFVAEHYHPYSEEFLYVVRGAVTARIDGVPVHLCQEEALLIPVNARHRVENNGSTNTHLVFHLGPLAPRPDLGHVDCEPLPGADSSSLTGGVS